MKSRLSNKARLASQSMDQLAASITNRNNLSVELTTPIAPSTDATFVKDFLLNNPAFIANNTELFYQIGFTATKASPMINLAELRVEHIIQELELSYETKDLLIGTLENNRLILEKFFSFNKLLVQQGSRENLIECVATESPKVFGLQGLLITPKCSGELGDFLDVFMQTSWGQYGKFWGKLDRFVQVFNQFGVSNLPIAGKSAVIQVWLDQDETPGILMFASEDENHFAEDENYLFDYLSYTAEICGKLFDRYII